jgi:hypothetical protein
MWLAGGQSVDQLVPASPTAHHTNLIAVGSLNE